MSDFRVISLPHFADDRGILTVADSILPFAVARLFWISGADGQTRGGHRHQKTRQALVAVQGAVSIYVNDGRSEARILLNEPQKCLIVEPGDWHTMTFDKGAILLVLASHSYDKNDYIDAPYG